MKPYLTIGMAVYNDYDGAYFTVQALRMYHDEVMSGTEIIIVDNNPKSGKDLQGLCNWTGARYIPLESPVGTSAPRDLIFREAAGEAVLCIDSHVLIKPGALIRLVNWYEDHPKTNYLYSGPMYYDDLKKSETHFADEWREEMWGTWAKDPRGGEGRRLPFEIPAMGLGLFTCRKESWLGFNPNFRGFGGEEFYIHEKFRQAGRRCVCLPWLRWMHRFGRPRGVPYPLTRWHKVRNYVIGHTELGLPLDRIHEHFVKSGLVSLVQWTNLTADPHNPPEDNNAIQPPALPKVACICCTFKKVPDHQYLLEEAIESFLRQDYPNKELIVLNDNPDQKLLCSARGVKVINFPERFNSVGEKFNAGIQMTDAEFLAPWDDDDISLPWRLSQGVTHIGTRDYWKPPQVWYLNSKLTADHKVGYRHHASILRRSAWYRVGGYAPMASAHDADMDAKLDKGQIPIYPAGIPKSQWAYIYRWGVHPYHISGHPDSEAFFVEQGKLPSVSGTFTLNPHWRADYVAMVKAIAPDSNTEAFAGKLVEIRERSRLAAQSEIANQPGAKCVHLGKATGKTHLCPNCGGHIESFEFECALHKRCTMGRTIRNSPPMGHGPIHPNDIPGCIDCPDRIPLVVKELRLC